jgi:hypothetical protein
MRGRFTPQPGRAARQAQVHELKEEDSMTDRPVPTTTNQQLSDVLNALMGAFLASARQTGALSDQYVKDGAIPFAYRIPKATIKLTLSAQQVTQAGFFIRLVGTSSDSKSDLTSTIEFDVVAVPAS